MMRRHLVVFAALAVLVGACTDGTLSSPDTTQASAVPTTFDVDAPPGATVAIALQVPESLAAHHAITPAALDIASLLHTGLTRRGENGLAEPALAATWSTLDQRTWTFNLQQNLRFNDGTPITAQSFVDSWQTLALQDTRSRNAYLGLVAHIGGWGEVLSGEEGRQIAARAIDDLSLQVQLDEPFPWFPELVAHPAFAPVAAAELAGRDTDDTSGSDGTEGAAVTTGPSATDPIGTGPFRISEPWTPGQVLLLSRVWGAGEPGAVSTFEVHFTSTDEEASSLITAGTVDVALIGRAEIDVEGVAVQALATDSLIYMGFPVSRAPTDEPFIRQALVHAIDRDRISEEVIGDTSIVNDSYAPLHSAGANLLLCSRCVFDPDTSRELLIEIEPPENSLSLHVVEGSAAEPWADAIAAMWTREVGWPVAVVRHDLPGLIGFLQSGVPDGPFLLEWTSEYPAAESWLEPLFDRSGLDDFTRFNDGDINAAFASLTALGSNSPNRTSLLKDIRTVLADRVPTIPLAVTTRRVATSDSVVAESLRPGAHLGLDGLRWLP